MKSYLIFKGYVRYTVAQKERINKNLELSYYVGLTERLRHCEC